MNRLILIGILWCLVISTGRAQEAVRFKEAGQTPTLETEQPSPLPASEPTPVNGQPSPFRPAKSELPRRAVEPKRIVIQPGVDAQESEVAMPFMVDLEKAGIAKIDKTEMTPTAESPIVVQVFMREDESFEKIKQFIVDLRASGVERLVLESGGLHLDGYGDEQFNGLSFDASMGYSEEELGRLEKVVRDAAIRCGLSLHFLGTHVRPSGPAFVESPDKAPGSSYAPSFRPAVPQLQTDYEAANKQAHDLAESLRETPDAAKKAELRTAVQSAFTLRQSLLRAELQEMQARLEKTQQSLDMRDRIADQIVDRRVEDLLNPQLKWDNSSKSEFHEQSSLAPKYQLLGFRLARDTAKKSDTIEAFMKPNITAIIPGSAAEASGFLPGDQVFAVNGLYTWGIDEFIRVIERQSAGPIECMILREQRSITLELQIPPEIAATPLAIAAQREDSRNTRMVAPVTELEGDWHLVSATDAKGKPVEFKPANLIFKNDQYTLAYQGGQIDRRVEVYPDSKEIRYFKDDSGFVQDHYLLEGDQLTIYNENRRNVYQRGYVVLPKSIPKATDEQKSRWRSGIVEILGGPSADKTVARPLIGYGVIVSPQMRIVSQIRLPDGDSAFFAKFDDGGVVPLKIVEEGQQGWLVCEPEQAVEANHTFRFSETGVGQHDEVRFWGRGTEGEFPKLRLSNTAVSDLERKSPALGYPVWQLLLQHNKLDGSLPVLDANGDLLAITIIGSNELLLAVPVSQLKTMFPKSFGPAADKAE